jgi:hypothetical protein
MEQDHMRKTLEHYRKLREKSIEGIKPQLDEIRGFDAMIRRLANDLNEPANIEALNLDVSPSLAMTAAPTSGGVNGSGIGRPLLRPDEYFQMSQSEAAKAYLRLVGRAISMDDLVSALQAGGAQVGGVDPKRTLQVSLKSNPKKEFVWPNKETIGLAEFYQRRK